MWLLHIMCMEWNVLQKRKIVSIFTHWLAIIWKGTWNCVQSDEHLTLSSSAQHWYHLSVHILSLNFCVQSNKWFIIHYPIRYCVQSTVFLLGAYKFESVLETLSVLCAGQQVYDTVYHTVLWWSMILATVTLHWQSMILATVTLHWQSMILATIT